MTTNKRDRIRESKLAEGLPDPLLDAVLNIPDEDLDMASKLLELVLAWKEAQSNVKDFDNPAGNGNAYHVECAR